MKLISLVLEFLFPPKCVLCGKILQSGELDLCRACRLAAPTYPNRKKKLQFLDSFAAVWYYEGNVRRSLLRYKFRGHRSYAASYGRLLAMMLEREYPEGFDVLTWVPVSRLRRFRRGYDQARLLAIAVGRELSMEPVPVLRKIRNNRPQSGLKGGEGSAHRRHSHHRRHRRRMRQGVSWCRGEGSTLRRCGGGTKVKV